MLLGLLEVLPKLQLQQIDLVVDQARLHQVTETIFIDIGRKLNVIGVNSYFVVPLKDMSQGSLFDVLLEVCGKNVLVKLLQVIL